MDEKLKAEVERIKGLLAKVSSDYRTTWLDLQGKDRKKVKKELAIHALDNDPEVIEKLEEEEERLILLQEQMDTLRIQREELQKQLNEANKKYLASCLEDYKEEKKKTKTKFKKAVKDMEVMLDELTLLSMASNDASNYANEPKLFRLDTLSNGRILFEKYAKFVEFYFE